jgi:hypothetical protein
MGNQKIISPLLLTGSLIITVFAISHLVLTATKGPFATFPSSELTDTVMWISLAFDLSVLVAATYGLLTRKYWAWVLTVAYFLWFSALALLMIINRQNLVEQYLFFVFFVIMLMYLFQSTIHGLFTAKTLASQTPRPEDVCRYGAYTLYCQEVNLRGNRRQTIYFFSKRIPKKGHSCRKPEGYAIKVNPRTGLPFLKKE